MSLSCVLPRLKQIPRCIRRGATLSSSVTGRHRCFVVISTTSPRKAPHYFTDNDRMTRRYASTMTAGKGRAEILALPEPFLRAYDSANFDPDTYQRSDVRYDTHSGKPPVHEDDDHVRATTSRSSPRSDQQIVGCQETLSGYRLKWKDGKESYYSKEWVNDQLKLWKASDTDRVLWTGLDESQVRSSADLSLEFPALLTDEGMKHALKALYQYGILLVTDTPIRDNGAGIAAMGAALGGGSIKNQLSIYKTYQDGNTDLVLPHGTDGPLRTLYGTVWATSSSSQVEGSSRADSAYGSDGLPLHTDMTYHRDPPGLQIFTMVRPSGDGGESVFGDGFAAAERLRQRHPRAFSTLSSTIRRYRSRDMDTGWHLEATGPLIQTDAANRVLAIRHNDLDRLPDLPPPPTSLDDDGAATTCAFYEELADADRAWDSVLAEDDIRLVMSLKSGETMVVANQVRVSGAM